MLIGKITLPEMVALTIKDGVIEAINLDKVIEDTSNKINKLLAGQKS